MLEGSNERKDDKVVLKLDADVALEVIDMFHNFLYSGNLDFTKKLPSNILPVIKSTFTVHRHELKRTPANLKTIFSNESTNCFTVQHNTNILCHLSLISVTVRIPFTKCCFIL